MCGWHFAVAAHLQTDISFRRRSACCRGWEFQQKCLGKMSDVAHQEGRTVLFVSHNLAATEQLCVRSILLDAGKVVHQGLPAEISRSYLDLIRSKKGPGTATYRSTGGELSVSVLDSGGKPTDTWSHGQPLIVRVEVSAVGAMRAPAIDLSFYDDRRIRLFAVRSDRIGKTPARTPGIGRSSLRLRTGIGGYGSYS